MAKPTKILATDVATSEPPQAATPARTPEAAPAPTPAPAVERERVETVPLQIRIPKADAKLIRVQSAEREMSQSDFVLTCVRAYLAANPQ